MTGLKEVRKCHLAGRVILEKERQKTIKKFLFQSLLLFVRGYASLRRLIRLEVDEQ